MKIYIRCKEWKSMQDDIPVRGTEIQSYLICHRQTWLLVHQMNPDPEDENIEIGRFLYEYRHGRNKKEIQIGAVNIDIIKRNDEQIVVQEVKKSSKAKESARYRRDEKIYPHRKYSRYLSIWGSRCDETIFRVSFSKRSVYALF